MTLNDREILQGAGNVSKKDADRIAHTEFEKYRVQQDKALISDFDRSIKALLATKPKPELSAVASKKPTRAPQKPKGGKE